jgi:hypothetical protein
MAEEDPRPALFLSLRLLSPATPLHITTTCARCAGAMVNQSGLIPRPATDGQRPRRSSLMETKL